MALGLDCCRVWWLATGIVCYFPAIQKISVGVKTVCLSGDSVESPWKSYCDCDLLLRILDTFGVLHLETALGI